MWHFKFDSDVFIFNAESNVLTNSQLKAKNNWPSLQKSFFVFSSRFFSLHLDIFGHNEEWA